MVKGGAFVYGSYPDIDALYPYHAAVLDRQLEIAGDGWNSDAPRQRRQTHAAQ